MGVHGTSLLIRVHGRRAIPGKAGLRDGWSGQWAAGGVSEHIRGELEWMNELARGLKGGGLLRIWKNWLPGRSGHWAWLIYTGGRALYARLAIDRLPSRRRIASWRWGLHLEARHRRGVDF